jgi:dipeptidyl aminopeptidase/acylaminoacyl peptidase
VKDGSRRTIAKDQRGSFSFSPKARFVYWYDWAKRHYYTYDVEKAKIVMASKGVIHPLWDEEDDHPDDPPPYGMASWTENDKQLIVYDRYDLWALDPTGEKGAEVLTRGAGRKAHIELRYLRLDPDEKFIRQGQELLFKAFDPLSKYGGFYKMAFDGHSLPVKMILTPHSYPSIVRATKAERYLVQRASIASSELYWGDALSALQPLTSIADQQKPYEWLSVELVKWKMFDGRMSEGLLYKPEHFDPSKKYPLIFYFYERDADGLYNYRAPAPSASTINIPYFVSNGYLVFDPNIYYKNGEPGGSAYNSVVSAAKYLSKMPWVDSTRLGIQGQSWGGYQVAYIITRTNMFAAAGAGAPVANMTSAYGGIRWGSGLNRQFQYERTQSRIGATLWQRPDLYLKNSPLFQADKIKTPLMMTHNDKDGAVPWYQGIEFFTALRRLGKKVWLLQYNDEDHNLVERRNRKDLSQRLSQFFDHFLKGAPMTTWLKQGVPAELKGIEWGLDVRSEK